jgi:F-type H+-transporting ATPase subunit b
MLELNKWFFVLLLNFLALLYVLNIILFKPLLKLFSHRENSIKDSLNAARDMDKKKEDAISRMNRELQDARNRARDVFENLRKEGLNRQKDMLEGANRQASELIQNARTELKIEAEKTRQRLRSDVDKFSDEIVRKLIGT